MIIVLFFRHADQLATLCLVRDCLPPLSLATTLHVTKRRTRLVRVEVSFIDSFNDSSCALEMVCVDA